MDMDSRTTSTKEAMLRITPHRCLRPVLRGGVPATQTLSLSVMESCALTLTFS